MSTTGIILCGGQSRRMGRPKSWLPLGNETFLERLVRLIQPMVSEVIVVAASNQDLPDLPTSVPILRDESPNRGPLQGLLTGLQNLPAQRAHVFVASCDIPLLEPNLVPLLENSIADMEAAVPFFDGQIHPLTALYRVCIRSKIEDSIQAGEFRMQEFVQKCRTRFVSKEELRSADPELRSFLNVNTPQDYVKMLKWA